ncbi:MAG: hypothetical protein ACFHU9_17455 [Fluviicola sp.]
MKSILSLFFMLFTGFSFSQEPHENPDHVKGNSATIYKALPFYNEACEYYANGDTVRAKLALFEAINTSFALTEAHLFLADIYRQQNISDSAFYFYNSGIDFAIEQDANYYFKLCETGMLHGQYDFIKHNLKHFKKLYGTGGETSPYEEGYPYARVDYEFYLDCMNLVYDYKSWENRFHSTYEIESNTTSAAHNSRGKLVAVKKGKLYLESRKKARWKAKAFKGISGDITYATLSTNEKQLVFTKTEGSNSIIYIGNRSGRTISNIQKLGTKVNDGNQNKTPFLHGNTLYFSSNRNGDYDLFVGHLDSEGVVTKVENLERVNSNGDDTSPYLNAETNTFYFASNGHPTFGGFDIMECTDHEVMNNVLYPINPRNPGASFNSYHDEMQISQDGEDYLLFRSYRKGGAQIQLLSPTEKPEQIYFEITPKNLTP